MQSLGHTTQGFFFAMASLRHKFDQPFGAGSLLLSLGLHLALVTCVLLAGWHKARVAPTIMEVSLVGPPPGDNSASPGKAKGGGLTQAVPAPAIKPAPSQPTVVKAPKKPVPPPAKKRRERAMPPSPSQVKAKARPPRPTPPLMTLAETPPPSQSTPAASENRQASSGTTGRGAAIDAAGTPGSGLERGSGRGSGGQGNKGGGSGGLAAAQNHYLSLIRARILAHRHYPPLARQRHMEGVVRLRFTLSATGALCQGVHVVKPSGFSVLDEQASQCVLAAAPFPSFPPELQRDFLTVEVPIIYRLKDWSS